MKKCIHTVHRFCLATLMAHTKIIMLFSDFRLEIWLLHLRDIKQITQKSVGRNWDNSYANKWVSSLDEFFFVFGKVAKPKSYLWCLVSNQAWQSFQAHDVTSQLPSWYMARLSLPPTHWLSSKQSHILTCLWGPQDAYFKAVDSKQQKQFYMKRSDRAGLPLTPKVCEILLEPPISHFPLL